MDWRGVTDEGPLEPYEPDEFEAFHVYLHARNVARLEGQLKAAQLNRSALIRRAIADVPLEILIRNGIGEIRPSSRIPGEMARMTFQIDGYCKRRLKDMTDAGFVAADLVRAALEPYWDMTLEHIQQLPDLFLPREQRRLAALRQMQAEKRLPAPRPARPPGDVAFTRAEIVREHTRRSFAEAVEKWSGLPRKKPPRVVKPPEKGKVVIGDLPPSGIAEVFTRAKAPPIIAPPMPIRSPAIDWSGSGPVQPRTIVNVEADARLSFERPPILTKPPARVRDPDPFEGIDDDEPTPAPSPARPAAPQLTALDVLRKAREAGDG